MKKNNEKKTVEKKSPTYVRVVAAVLAGLLTFGVVAMALSFLVIEHVH